MSLENPEQKSEIEKPPVLYHASLNKDVKEFEPRAETFRDPEEGPVVFATPDKAYASCFIVSGINDRWCQISVFDGSIHVMIISDKERFLKIDKGGAIYALPSETFETDPEKSKTGREWTSREPVKPSDKTEYKTGLQAMIENDVQVYFVDRKTFERIQKSEDYGFEIIKSLKSENQK